ncbi:MAG: hypothetical protein ACKVVT_06945 [Dehalococcoidia bacterium]
MVANRTGYLLSLPERGVRALAAALFGATHEAAELVLPRLVRRSRLYEVTAKNALRIAIELVGRVEAPQTEDSASAQGAGKVAIKKAAGNVVEFGSIAAFGFSPIWLLAGASDLVKGSRVYLQAIEDELAARGILAEGTHFGSVDQLLGALEGTSGHTAGMMDLPPLEVSELRRSLAELKADVTSLPSPADLTQLFNGLVATARREDRSLLEVSSGVGMAFLTSARNLTRDHLVAPYAQDWQPLRREGFAAYGARVAKPYREAVEGHFDPARTSFTERAPGFAKAAPGAGRRMASKLFRRVRQRLKRGTTPSGPQSG